MSRALSCTSVYSRGCAAGDAATSRRPSLMRRVPTERFCALGLTVCAGCAGRAGWRRPRPRGDSGAVAVPRLEKFHLPPAPRISRTSGSFSVMEFTCMEWEKMSGKKLTPTSSDLAFRNVARPKLGSSPMLMFSALTPPARIESLRSPISTGRPRACCIWPVIMGRKRFTSTRNGSATTMRTSTPTTAAVMIRGLRFMMTAWRRARWLVDSLPNRAKRAKCSTNARPGTTLPQSPRRCRSRHVGVAHERQGGDVVLSGRVLSELLDRGQHSGAQFVSVGKLELAQTFAQPV